MSGLKTIPQMMQSVPGAIRRRLDDKACEVVSVTDVLPRGYVTDGSVDYTAQVQAVLDAMPGNFELVIPARFVLGVTRLAVNGKNDWRIKIEGQVKNLGAKPGAAATDTNTAARGVGATFYITNSNRFAIYGKGRIDNGYREAFCIGETLPASVAAPCSDFVLAVDVRGRGINDNMHANRLRYCSNFAVMNMTIDAATKKPAYVDNAHAYYSNWCESLLLWDCTDFYINGLTSSNGAMNGIYVGSNCERFSIQGCRFIHNAGSGAQLAWSSFGIFPRYFSFSGNYCAFNRADGWDINNTGALQDIFGVFTSNTSFYNGWGTEDTAGTTPTNDGSGIGTFINVKKITVSNNLDVECARTGCYMEAVWDASVTDNIIKKEAAASVGDGLYMLRCTNIDAHSNNVNVLATKSAWAVYGDNPQQGNIRASENYLFGLVKYDGGAYSGSFNGNKVLSAKVVQMPVDAVGNDITVSGAGENGLYALVSDITFERNRVAAPNFAIVVFGFTGVKLVGNYADGGVGGIRVDTTAYTTITGNHAKGKASPGIHLLNSSYPQLSMNIGESTTGNALRIEAECTFVAKWANKAVGGAVLYAAGSYTINY